MAYILKEILKLGFGGNILKNRLHKLTLLGLAISGLTIGSSFAALDADASTTMTISNLKDITRTEYVKKATKGWTYNIDTTKATFTSWGKKTHYLKNYPNTTWVATKSAVITPAGKGSGLYYFVTNGNGDVSGWIWSGYLNAKGTAVTPSVPSSPASNSFDKVYETAKKYIGTPYVYGGTTPAGFDCSGYTQYVYKHSIKQNLARTAQAQYNSTEKVATADTQKGDLVYFGTSKNNITHVGINIGNGNMIDAQNYGVIIEKINAPWWNKVGYSRPTNLVQ